MATDGEPIRYLRPRAHLVDIARKHPNAWDIVDQIRRGYVFPDWCFCPQGAVEFRVPGGEWGESAHLLKYWSYISDLLIGGLAAWRATQGIYLFDPTVLDALWTTPLSGDIPTDVLDHLPEWCVYIPTPGKTFMRSPLHGFFANRTYGITHRSIGLLITADCAGERPEDRLRPWPIALNKGTLSDGLASSLAEGFSERDHRFLGDAGYTVDAAIEDISPGLSSMVSVLLYLCSQNAEIGGHGTLRPNRPQPKKTKRGMRCFLPDKPTHWEVGYRLGAALRKAMVDQEREASEAEPGHHASPRPHIRRAHWHSFWTGSKAEPATRKAVLKWLPPIPVMVEDVEDLVPTVRPVPATS